MERIIVIDPAGTPPIRPVGVNLVITPETPLQSEESEVITSDLNSAGRPIYGTSAERYSFSTTCMLGENNWRKLHALQNWVLSSGQYEIVIYQLFDKISEITQTRKAVPTFSPVTTSFGITYYPVLQGIIECQGNLIGYSNEPQYSISLSFFEGTIIQP